MMRNNVYTKQLYHEGLGITFYQKPKNFINNHIQNKLFQRVFLLILELIYILFLLVAVIVVFNLNFPF